MASKTDLEAARAEAVARKLAAVNLSARDWDADKGTAWSPAGRRDDERLASSSSWRSQVPAYSATPRYEQSRSTAPPVDNPKARPPAHVSRAVYEPPAMRRKREERERKAAEEVEAREAAEAEAQARQERLRKEQLEEARQAGQRRARAEAAERERKENLRRAAAAEERNRNAEPGGSDTSVATRLIASNIELTRAAKADARSLVSEKQRAVRAREKERADLERQRREEADAVWDED